MKQFPLTCCARDFTVGAGFSLLLLLGAAGTANADSPPKVDHSKPTPQPDYPATAQTGGEQGDVVLGVLVNTHGRPLKIRVNQSSGFVDLDDAAAAAVAGWHYLPAIKDGDTATDWAQVKIHFELPQAAQALPAATDAATGSPTPIQH